MIDLDEISMYANPGHDRDAAEAMLSQSRLGLHPIDQIQVRHLLQIGYRAGRKVTEDDRRFDATDQRLGRWQQICLGTVLGALLCGTLFWMLS